MIGLLLDSCFGKGLKSPLHDVCKKELCLSDPVIVEFYTPQDDGITLVNYAMATVVYCEEKNEWGLNGGGKLGMLAAPLTQEYICEHNVTRNRPEDVKERNAKLLKYLIEGENENE